MAEQSGSGGGNGPGGSPPPNTLDPARVFSAIAKAMVGAIENLSDSGQPVGRHAAFEAMMDMTAVFAVSAGLTGDAFADAAARAWGTAVAVGARA